MRGFSARETKAFRSSKNKPSTKPTLKFALNPNCAKPLLCVRFSLYKLKNIIMKLIDKLLHCPDENGWTNPNITRSENLEKIAEDFAVEFSKWLRKNTAQTKGGSYKLFNDFQKYNLTELVQIFKNQKNI